MLRFVLIASLSSIFGWGNSDLESAIYKQKKGVVLCAQCFAGRKKADEEQMMENYKTLGPLSGLYQKQLSEMSESYYRTSLYLSNVDITKVSSFSTNIKDVWDVKIVG